MSPNSNKPMKMACFLALAALALVPVQALAGFGIAPTYITNQGLFQGEDFEQTIYLLRSRDKPEGRVSMTIRAAGFKDWGIDGRTEKIVFPPGSERLPINFKISAPFSAKTGKYSGRVEFLLSEYSGISIGASAALELNVLDKDLKGRILIQTEENGEAWYVNPADCLRYYLARPADAFGIMSKLSLGAAHSYLAGRDTFPDSLLGRVLLDVDDRGKAYYIFPGDRKAYYLAGPKDAFNIMKKFGLGVKNTDLDSISVGE